MDKELTGGRYRRLESGDLERIDETPAPNAPPAPETPAAPDEETE